MSCCSQRSSWVRSCNSGRVACVIRVLRTCLVQNACAIGTSTGNVSTPMTAESAADLAKDSTDGAATTLLPVAGAALSTGTSARARANTVAAQYAASTNQNGLTMVDSRTNCTCENARESIGKCSS